MCAISWFAAFVLLVGTAAPAWAQSFIDGLAAYDAGRYAETARIWGELAEEGDAMAQLGLAGLYRQGLGVPRDLAEAARLYRQAALQGNDDAQINLARLYAEGAGVPRDPVRAYKWFGLAAAKGRDWAKARRDELAETMTPEQIAEAERLIEQFHPE